jgi:opacity protein-like surface antigen
MEDRDEMKQLSQLAIGALVAVHAGLCAAQDSPRAGKWEFSLQPQYIESKSISSDRGSRAELDEAWGFGFGVAYNLNDHFALGGEFVWSEADYDATIAPDNPSQGVPFTVSGEIETATLRLNATFNLLKSAFTPFVTGGLGATYVDTNVPDGPPNTICWWDPWWGYYCGTDVPTKDETYFSYMAGAGLRWDSPGGFFLRGLVARQWVDVGDGIGTPGFTQYRIDLGWRF